MYRSVSCAPLRNPSPTALPPAVRPAAKGGADGRPRTAVLPGWAPLGSGGHPLGRCVLVLAEAAGLAPCADVAMWW